MKLPKISHIALGLLAATLFGAGVTYVIGLRQAAPQANQELLKEKTLAEAKASTRPEPREEEVLMKKPGAVRVPILTYHYIRTVTDKKDILGIGLSVPPAAFAEQMQYIAEHGYHAITPQDLLDAIEKRKTLPEKPILLTFDDGHRDFYTDAFPVLEKYHLQSTIFVVPDFLEKEEYLTKKELRELITSPLITVGAHTMDHSDLPRLSAKRQRKEIIDSKKWLEDFTEKKVDFFAYPYGHYNDDIIGMVKNAGFLSAFSTHGGVWHDTSTRFTLHRLSVFGTIDLETFIKRIRI